MRVIALAALVACAHAAPRSTSPSSSDTAIKRQTYELLDAFDRGDAPALIALTDPSFVRFEGEKISPRADGLAYMKPKPPMMTRSWRDEHVYVRDHDATFIGMAIEHETGNDSHGNREYDGWYMVSWTRDGAAWKAVSWAWEPHRAATDRIRDVWNDNFRQDIGFEHAPNHLLATAIAGVKPGTALDVATGQGRNAVFLATEGWTVTAIDLADEGLRRAREAAAAHHVAIDVVQADANSFDYGVAKWDLVTLIYAPGSDERFAKIARSLKPGGLIVVEFFLDIGDGDGGIKAGQLAKAFGDGFDIVRDEIVDDRPDWGVDKAKLVRFIARRR